MRAAVFYGERDVRIDEVAEPPGARANEVLVRPIWCGICGTDLHEYSDGPIVIPTEPHALTGAHAPQILGHEFSAEVVEVGKDVGHVRVGQHVSVMPIIACGRCHNCVLAMGHLCVRMACVGLSYLWGGLGELAIVPASQVHVLPDEMSPVEGALVEPTAVAVYGVDTAGVRPGDTVLITGAGPIGALAAIYAASLGARVVISEMNPVRLELARSLDVGTVVDAAETDVVQFIAEATKGVGADRVVECSGNEGALLAGIDAVRAAGVVTQTGLHTRPAALEPMKIALREITYNGTWCYRLNDWPRVIDLISRRGLEVESVVTGKIGIADVVSGGFDALLSPVGEHVKLLVSPN